MIVKGQKISDRYQIIRSIGEGGMANVYLAQDTILDRLVAVKVLRGDLSNDDKFIRRFQREALSASNLSHPNIVDVYDVGEENGQYYIVMEFIEGSTLKQLLQKRGTLTLSETLDIMSQLTDGLAHAHDSYIIHRDIKPQNILIVGNGLVKITDFGIAMALNSSQLTQTNSIMGSVHYLPPEQANGKGSTIKSDIYSLGIVMYELLTGHMPFKGENAVEIALKHMKDPMPSVKKEIPVIPQSVENIILKATAKNPKNRYESVRDMYEDLQTCLNEENINQPRYFYKYPENDLDDTKVMPVIKEDKVKKEQTEELVPKEEKTKFSKAVYILGAVFLGLLLILGLIVIILPRLTKVPDVKIPDVSDMTVIQAEAKLKKLSLDVEVKTIKISSDDIKEGKVVKTDPAKGRTVKEGTSITIYESSGKETIEVKEYVGKDYNTVKAELEATGKINVLIEKKSVEDSTKYKGIENLIIAQSPAKGTKISPEDTVTLYIPDIKSEYPDFVGEGWSASDIEAFAKKYSLVFSTITVIDNSKEEGTVISQSRTAGSEIVAGTSLKITITKKQVDPVEDLVPQE